MSDRLEERLSDLGAYIDAPACTDLPERVRERLEGSSQRRSIVLRGRRAVLLAAAIVVLAAGGAIAALSIRGVRITIDPAPTVTPRAGATLRLGEPTTLAAARARAGFPIPVPRALGPPDEVWIDRDGPATPVTLVYRARVGLPRAIDRNDVAVLLTQLRAGINDAVFAKIVGSSDDVRSVTVDGSPGYWIRGKHYVSYVAPDGSMFDDTLRLSASTLLWERDGVTFRLESSLPLDRALLIAGSLG